MVKNKNGLSHEFIIHPGETLKELIEDRKMSQKELALRTGNSPKHISDVVNCLKPISVDFAKKLEYALGIDASFWINLQANYFSELADYEELNHISANELKVVKKMKEIIGHLKDLGLIKDSLSNQKNVIDLRKLLNISSLDNIPKIAAMGSYRIAQSTSVDPYILFSWIRMTELMTTSIILENELNIELLKTRIPDIKQVMFCDAGEIRERLQNIFAECGVKFTIAKNFKGAPVQGVISKEDNELSLIMTIRHKYADIFWFTLFHEIGHIINGDIKKRLIDYHYNNDITEFKADEFARNALINQEMYIEFVEENDFSIQAIRNFAENNEVQSYIVLGRLQKENYIDYKTHYNEKLRYEWA